MLMEKRREIFSKIAYGCFYTGVVIEVLLVLIDKSALVNPIEGRIFQLTFLLFTVKAALTKYSFREYVVAALFLALGAISYFVTGRNEIIRFVMFIVACKDMDMKKCLKLVFWMTLTGCVLIMLLAVTGIYGSVSLTQDYGRGSVETRYTLGLGHPNALQCMFLMLAVLAFYLYGESMKWHFYLILFLINGFLFLLTDSKASFLIGIFAIIYVGIIQLVQSDKLRIVLCIAGITLMLASIGVSIFIASKAYHVYNYAWGIDQSQMPTFMTWLDKVLTGRIRTLVGTTRWEGTIQTWKLFSESKNNYYFDMGWIRLFYWYGIVPAMIVIIVLLIYTIYCIKQKYYIAIVMLVSFSLYTLIEAHIISVYIGRNYILFLLGDFWYHFLEGLQKSRKSA